MLLDFAALVAMLPRLGRAILGLTEWVFRSAQNANYRIHGLAHIFLCLFDCLIDHFVGAIPAVGWPSGVLAQQNTESSPQASQVCLTVSFLSFQLPVVVMVDLQLGQ